MDYQSALSSTIKFLTANSGLFVTVVSLAGLLAAFLKTLVDLRPARWRKDDWDVLKIKCEIMTLQKQHELPSLDEVDALVRIDNPKRSLVVRFARLIGVFLRALELIANLLCAGLWLLCFGILTIMLQGLIAGSPSADHDPAVLVLVSTGFALVGMTIGKVGTYFEDVRVRLLAERATQDRRREIIAAAGRNRMPA